MGRGEGRAVYVKFYDAVGWVKVHCTHRDRRTKVKTVHLADIKITNLLNIHGLLRTQPSLTIKDNIHPLLLLLDAQTPLFLLSHRLRSRLFYSNALYIKIYLLTHHHRLR